MMTHRFAPRLFFAALVAVGLAACQTTQTGSTGSPSPQPQTISVTPNVNALFTVSIAPSVPTPVVLGQEMRFRVQSSETGFANVYMLGASGQSLVVAENMPLQAGRVREVPDPVTGFSLTATPPVGTDRVILLVTRSPMAGIVTGSGAAMNTPQGVTLSHADLVARINAKTAAIPDSNWATAEGAVTVVGGRV